eukprot:TRINITY_DN2916_c0_g1_i1.p1 TRINITY_DN2916_c0_g1~~TRINITY_DN2916_c0_g1_i1.p1  ORF type:complete len:535 (-),score=69.48 TRINITY_DN2916_c0_g1_i1:48-1652(-)
MTTAVRKKPDIRKLNVLYDWGLSFNLEQENGDEFDLSDTKNSRVFSSDHDEDFSPNFAASSEDSSDDTHSAADNTPNSDFADITPPSFDGPFISSFFQQQPLPAPSEPPPQSNRQQLDDYLKKFAKEHNMKNFVLPPSSTANTASAKSSPSESARRKRPRKRQKLTVVDVPNTPFPPENSQSIKLKVSPSEQDNAEVRQPQQIFHSLTYPSRGQSTLTDQYCNAILQTLSAEHSVDYYCAKLLNYLCGLLGMEIGAIYINSSREKTTKEWRLCSAYPSVVDFNSQFVHSSGVTLIRKVATEKKAFCASADGKNFIFVPMTAGYQVPHAVVIVGAAVSSFPATDVSDAMAAIRQICGEAADHLLRISRESKEDLVNEIKILRNENKTFKQRATFHKSLLMSSLSLLNNVVIIAVNTKGVISYITPFGQRELGYKYEELIGVPVILLHDVQELNERKAEIEELSGEVIEQFDVFVHSAKCGQPESRIWTMVRKDRSSFLLKLTVSPLLNAADQIVGFIGVGLKEDNASYQSEHSKR